MENRRIWIVAPDAYQNAPLMPYCHMPQTRIGTFAQKTFHKYIVLYGPDKGSGEITGK